MLVILAALGLFEVGGFGLQELTGDVADRLGSEPAVELAELRARLAWLTAVLLHLASSAAALVVAGGILRRCVSAPGRRAYAAAGVGLIALELVVGLSDGLAPAFHAIYAFTAETLGAWEGYRDGEVARVRATVQFLNVVSAIAPVVVLLAGCACGRPTARPTSTTSGRR